MTPENPKCENCQYGMKTTTEVPPKTWILCRRYPPTFIGVSWAFPLMEKDGFCGEHTR